jgi:hypothetical protein
MRASSVSRSGSSVSATHSRPAPLFKLVAQPNDWHAQVASATKVSNISGKGQLYVAFWERFLERIHPERPGWTKARKALADNWLTMPSPFKGGGVIYSVNFPSGGKLRYELYIDNGDASANLALFEALRTHQKEIEEAFGAPLSWEDLPTRKACRVAAYGEGDVARVDDHDAYVDWFIDTGTRLREALQPYAGLTPTLGPGEASSTTA